MSVVRRLKHLPQRVLCAFFPRLAKPDDEFANEHLSPVEYDLYLKMDPRDREHANKVAKAVLATPDCSKVLVRAALLHDVGKSIRSYKPLERIAVHLYTPKNVPRKPHLSGIKGAWQRRHYHAAYGAELIRAAGGDEQVAEIVERHHQPEGHPEASLLKSIEEIY